MTTGIRKRGQVLRNMRYDRVDLVEEGANGKADILIAKNKTASSKPVVVRKKMATYECADCEHTHKSVKKSLRCESCGSKNLNYIEVQVTKSTTPAVKQEPKNDDSTNAGQYSFEDEQYDQDNGENGVALGEAVEKTPVNKGWFEIGKGSLTHQNEKGDGGDVDTVDNEKNEEEREGSQSDKKQELLAMTLPVGKKRRLRKEKPILQNYDLENQGSQVKAESAEQMYRSTHKMDPQSQEHRESTMSDAFSKARRKRTNHEGLKKLESGTDGIHNARGVKRNGTNTGSSKPTKSGRTSVRPPVNNLDKSRRVTLKKSSPSDEDVRHVQTLEALNLATRLAENVGLILKSGKPELYEAAMEDFIDNFNAAAETWFDGSSITKSADADAQAEDVASRTYAIISKASSDSDDSDDDDDDDDSSSNKLKNMKGDGNVDKKKGRITKSADVEGDPYGNVTAEVKKKLNQLDQLLELQEQQKYDTMAEGLRHLPGFNQEQVAKSLRTAYESSEEGGEYLLQTLTASANQQKDSSIYKQLGMPGTGTMASSDPMAQAYAYADSKISKGADGPTREQLTVEYMLQHPDEFYQAAK